ncbi:MULTISPECIES: regulator [unclassified Streptomyces]|uniref:regulator n=1 Tax=unclassified Streptomyces TaxID=2593676 RepID=UPI0022B73632|nr:MULTISPECIES: regulator [unclassified Streptomyces]MCZ7413955.1 regulator [Streptomyces sp. WMMC897]MCZ7430951.1 regulator [Streptomyces sp. WMMC1477]
MPTERPGARPSAQRTHNRQLAALIAEAGFSNAGLARRVDQLGLEHGLDLRYDKTSVTRWLRGQQPRGTTPALIAEVFTRRLGRRLSAQDLGLDPCAPVYAGLEFAATCTEAVDIVSGLWRKDAGSHRELRKIAFTPAGLVVPSRDWLIGRPDEHVGRGEPPAPPPPVPVRTGPTTAGPPAPSSPARIPAQSRPAAAAHRGARGERPELVERNPGQPVGEGDVAALRSVAELFRSLDAAHGGGHARQALVRYLEHETEPLLRGAYGHALGRRLFAAAAELTRLAGWTAYDVAAHGLAQRYFVQALRLSQAAGDRAYGGRVLATMSEQAVYLGHGREAVQLARVAQQGVGPDGPGPVQALLHAAEARGHALLGDGRSAAAALSRAERSLETAGPDGQEEEGRRWARVFGPARFADAAGHCHRDLRQYRAAALHAERALRLREPGQERGAVLTRLVLAGARLGLGEVEEACQLAAEAARGASELRSMRAHEYVRDFERRLEPHRDAPPVRGYRERVAALG